MMDEEPNSCLLVMSFFAHTSDPLLSSSEALRFEIVKRELENFIEPVMVGENMDCNIRTHWGEPDMPEDTIGIIAFASGPDVIYGVFETLTGIPIAFPGTLFVAEEDKDDLLDFFDEFLDQIEVCTEAEMLDSPGKAA